MSGDPGRAETGALRLVPLDDECVVLFTVPPAAPLVVGREPECGLRLHDRQVSKRHARLACTDGRWTVTDVGSRNGTSVNDVEVTSGTEKTLADNDQVRFGPCVFRVRLNEAPRRRRALPSTSRYMTRASMFEPLKDSDAYVRDLGWQEFRKRYAPVIVGFTRNAGLPGQDADDVLQEVMLGFFRVAKDFEYDPAKGRFRGYLKRATFNVIRKRARKKGAIPFDLEHWEESPESEDSWEPEWAKQVFARAIEEVRDRFDAQTFEAFELYARRGVPAKEVADRLGISIDSVHQAKTRVMKAVREVVDRIRDQEG